MNYPFVQAYHDVGVRKGPVLGFIIHMAEGGGTVGYLSRANLRGVSVHYVIERSGRTVQMLLETHAAGSIDPDRIRTTEGPSPYGASAARAALGAWAHDPNAATLSVEIEGYAADGPNPDQVTALRALVTDLRSRYPAIALLGHRDFADYKACPGVLIPWAALGGHGPSSMGSMEESMFPVVTVVPLVAPSPRKFVIAAGVTVAGYNPAKPGVVVKSVVGPTGGTMAHADAEVSVSWIGTTTPPTPRGGPFLRVTDGVLAGLLIVKALVTLDPASPTVDTTPFGQSDIDAAKAAAVAAFKAKVAALS